MAIFNSYVNLPEGITNLISRYLWKMTKEFPRKNADVLLVYISTPSETTQGFMIRGYHWKIMENPLCKTKDLDDTLK